MNDPKLTKDALDKLRASRQAKMTPEYAKAMRDLMEVIGRLPVDYDAVRAAARRAKAAMTAAGWSDAEILAEATDFVQMAMDLSEESIREGRIPSRTTLDVAGVVAEKWGLRLESLRKHGGTIH